MRTKNYLLRSGHVRRLASPYYEEGRQDRCWKWVWRHKVYPVYPMAYKTFLRHLRVDAVGAAGEAEDRRQLRLFA